jgi:ribonuclease HI
MITIYIDGASIGNPGKVGIGYLLYKDNELLKQEGVYLGIQTNNFAEYMALIFALTECLGLGEKKCKVFSDSQLLCEQINGNYKVKNKNIHPLFVLAKKIISQFKDFSITHIDREKNKEADRLAKEATGFLV